MKKCVFCKLRYTKESKISFHKFPTDVKFRSSWLKNMNALNWTPKESDHLCSQHFEANSFIKYESKSTLKWYSVPTIFEGKFENPNSTEKPDTDHSENVCVNNEMDVKDPTPVEAISDLNKDATATSSSGGMAASPSATRAQTPRCGVKRTLKNNNLGKKVFTKDACTNTVNWIWDNVRHDHAYSEALTPNTYKTQYSLSDDNTLKPLKKDELVKLALKRSNVRIKVLTQRLKRLKISLARYKSVIRGLKSYIKGSAHARGKAVKLF